MKLAWRRRRGSGALDRRLIEDYLARGGPAKLHIGCGENLLEGWLNSDLYPGSDRVLHFDATGRFPFADATFDYVFSEHMIEHVPYEGALSMLRECRRVLKPGGRARISTPDLRFLVGLYAEDGPVRRFALNESDDPALRSLENEARLPEGFVRLESLTLEATRQ